MSDVVDCKVVLLRRGETETDHVAREDARGQWTFESLCGLGKLGVRVVPGQVNLCRRCGKLAVKREEARAA